MGFRPDQVVIAPSRQWRGLLFFVHLLAAVALWCAQLPLVIAVFGTLLLALAAVWADHQLGRLQADTAVQGLRWDADQLWVCQSPQAWWPATLGEHSVIHPRFMLLELYIESGGARRRVHQVLLPDALGAAAYRRLQVELSARLGRAQFQS